jgi:hypothetical protein
MRRTLAAGLGIGAVNALLALLAVRLLKAHDSLSSFGWFGSSNAMPRRYADYLPGTTSHLSAAVIAVLVAAFLVANVAVLGFGYSLGRGRRA